MTIKPQGRGNGVMMIDKQWFSDLSKQWGRSMRSNIPYKDRTSLTARVVECGPDGSIPDSFGSAVPYVGLMGDLGKFHRVWTGCPSPMKLVIWVSYAQKGSPKMKAAELGMTETDMYNCRSNFMHYYEGKTDGK